VEAAALLLGRGRDPASPRMLQLQEQAVVKEQEVFSHHLVQVQRLLPAVKLLLPAISSRKRNNTNTINTIGHE
jgi:hypothetical protein